MPVLLTARLDGRTEYDVLVRLPSGKTLGDVLDHIYPEWRAAKPFLSVGGSVVSSDSPLGISPLVSGVIVDLAAEERADVDDSCLPISVDIVGGLSAGCTRGLGSAELSVGRGHDNPLQIQDSEVSRRHLVISSDGALQVRDEASSNGTIVAGERVEAATRPVAFGDLIQFGRSALVIRPSPAAAAVTTPAHDGTLLVNRAAGTPLDCEPVLLDWGPRESERASRPRVQLAAAVLPTLLAVGMALVLHNLQLLAFSLLTPATLLATSASEQWTWRRLDRRTRRELSEQTHARAAELTAALRAEEQARREQHPDAPTLIRTARQPGTRLWERRRDDARFLQVRLGLADRAASTRTSLDTSSGSSHLVHAVPAVVDVKACSYGITGLDTHVQGLARWVMVQALVLHAPSDLTVWLILGGDLERWRWARWAPALAVVATDDESRTYRLMELARSVRKRVARTRGEAWTGPRTLVIIDPASTVVDSNDLSTVLTDGVQVGISVLMLDRQRGSLPLGLDGFIDLAASNGGEIVTSGAGRISGLAVEGISTDLADQVARGLASLVEASGQSGGLPARCEWIGISGATIDAVRIENRWRGPGRSAPIGRTTSGVFDFDLATDGPHLLVAGTTGAGKSEFLRTLIAGLATTYAPDQLSFVLVDYKGGAAFAECVALPHVLGVVTDLDPQLTSRAIRSLEAELRKRESVLARAACTDLDEYQRSGAQPEILPRLVIVIDEFAALVEELPQFVSGLIGIAQRGRSLGVHLVLATQRPGGIVSPEIRANITSRIALRVTDDGESTDVIDSPIAASISAATPGRGFARLSDGLVEFQTGITSMRVDAQRPAVELLDRWNQSRASTQPTRQPGQSPSPGRSEGSESALALLAEACGRAWSARGRLLPAPPWLPPLPERIDLDTVDLSDRPASELALGIADLPDRQQQSLLTHDLKVGGSLAFIGRARSGRTSALRLLLAQSTERVSPTDLSTYVIDCAGCALTDMTSDHARAVLTDNDFASVARLLALLEADLHTRRSSAGRLPYLLVLDGWDRFVALSDEYDSGRSAERALELLRNAESAAITVAVTGDRTLLGIRASSAVGRRFLLRQSDEAEFLSASASPGTLSRNRPPGRAIEAEAGHEIQLAFLDEKRAIAPLPSRGPVNEVDTPEQRPLPARLHWEELAMPRQRPDQGSRITPLGIGGDGARQVGPKLLGGQARFLVVGPPRSGRTNAMATLARSAAASNVPVLALTTSSGLRAMAQRLQTNLDRPAVLDEVVTGRPAIGLLSISDAAASELLAEFARGRNRVLLVDDVDDVVEEALADQLVQICANEGLTVVASARVDDAAMSFRGVIPLLRRARSGLLLQPRPGDGEVLGISVAMVRGRSPVGRGLLVTDDVRSMYPEGMPVQVALSDGPPR